MTKGRPTSSLCRKSTSNHNPNSRTLNSLTQVQYILFHVFCLVIHATMPVVHKLVQDGGYWLPVDAHVNFQIQITILTLLTHNFY